MRTSTATMAAISLVLIASCASSPGAASGARETLAVELAREELPTMSEVRASLKSEGGSLIVGRISGSIEAAGTASPGGVPIRKGEPGYEPATDSDVTDVKLLAGQPVGDDLVLHQLLAPNQEYDSIPKLDVGKTYVMAIRPFTFGDPSVRTGQYILVGLEAAWVQKGDAYVWVGKPEKSSARYPATASLDQIRTALTP